MTTSWSVISIMREPLETTLRFAAWYLDAGADRLVLHFDDPDDPAIIWLRGLDRIEVVRCTPRFWQQLGAETDMRFSLRQNMAMTDAYRRIDTGWVLNVDADELLHVEGGIVPHLASAPDDVLGLRVPTAEALHVPDDEAEGCFFRRPMRRGFASKVYGDDLPYFARKRFGLTGHAQGKSLTRAGLKGVRLRQHWGVDGDGNPVRERILGPEAGAHLLHFADQGYDIWRSKIPWRLDSRGIAPALAPIIGAALDAADSEREMRAIYEKLYFATPDRLRALDAHQALLRLSLDFEALVAQYFGQAALKVPA